MGYYKTKINGPDKLFSNYIRQKAGWRCERCGKLCKIDGKWVAKLEASHYHIRDHYNTRYDEENVYALCFNCHRRMGEYKNTEDGEYDLWVKGKLGEDGYLKLKLRANMRGSRDLKLWTLYVKQLLKQ